jgi:hypothetical protein
LILVYIQGYVEEAVSAMEKGKGAWIPVTKKPNIPTQSSRPTVTKNQQNSRVLPGLEIAMMLSVSLSTRKRLCDVTNKSKPNDQLASSNTGNVIPLFDLKAQCVFIICLGECPVGNRKNVQDSKAVEVEEPFPVLGKTSRRSLNKSQQ